MPLTNRPANAVDIESDVWCTIQDRGEAFACRWSATLCTRIPPQLRQYLTPAEFEQTMTAVNAAIDSTVGSGCCSYAGVAPNCSSRCLGVLAVLLLPVAFTGYLIIECQLRRMADSCAKAVAEALRPWATKGLRVQAARPRHCGIVHLSRYPTTLGSAQSRYSHSGD